MGHRRPTSAYAKYPDILQNVPAPLLRKGIFLKKLQPYFPPLVTLARSLLMLGRRVIRQLVLPSRGRKGNLLSSLFVLFTGLSEQFIGFAQTIARIPGSFRIPAILDPAWAFSRRHLRRGMVVAVWALFILSSLEWTGRQQTNPAPPATEQRATTPAVASVWQAFTFADEEALPVASSTQRSVTVRRTDPRCATIPRWLLFGTILR